MRNVFRAPRFVAPSESESVGRLKLPRVDISRLSQSAATMDTASHVSTASALTHLKSNSIGDQADVDDLMARDIPEASSLEVSEYLRDADVGGGEDWWKEDGNPMLQDSKGTAGMKGHWTAILIGSGVFLVVGAVVTLLPRTTFTSPRTIQTNITQAISTVKVQSPLCPPKAELLCLEFL